MYRRIAPGARILLIQSAVPILVSSYARQRAAIGPAVGVVVDLLEECGWRGLKGEDDAEEGDKKTERNGGTTPKILLHMFSNGGTNTATQFLFVLNERLRSPLPLSGMLYDSCPAKGTYWKDHRAMVYSLPKDIISRTIGNIIVHIILLMLHTEIACGLENPSSLLRRTLLDEKKIRGRVTSAGEDEKGTEQPVSNIDSVKEEETTTEPKQPAGKRSCYLYSKSDQMVDWTDIRDHAAEARRKGWDVEELVFDGSPHCGHFQKDEERYVQAMERMWAGDDGVQETKSKL